MHHCSRKERQKLPSRDALPEMGIAAVDLVAKENAASSERRKTSLKVPAKATGPENNKTY